MGQVLRWIEDGRAAWLMDADGRVLARVVQTPRKGVVAIVAGHPVKSFLSRWAAVGWARRAAKRFVQERAR